MTLPANLKTFFPLPKIYKTGPVTAEVAGVQPVPGETIPRRNIKYKDALVARPTEEVATIHDILKYAAAKYGNAKALGARKVIKTHQEVKKIKKVVDGKEVEVDKKWTFLELSGYEYLSFVELEKKTLQIGAGLRKLGLVAGDKLHMFAATQ
jgi:long-chain acyl-CoA synthetase